MFASVNARAEWNRLSAGKRSETGDVTEKTSQSPEKFLPKQTKSLALRRVQNLTAILQLSLLRRDLKRAQRAFSLLLRCEKHGVTLRKLWELGSEAMIRSTGVSKSKAEEFLVRVRLSSSEVGRHSTTEEKVMLRFFLINSNEFS